MTVEDMRYELMKEYPSERWRTRCLQMSPYQIIAIYKSIRNRKKKTQPLPQKDPGFEQIKFDLGSLM